MKSVLVIGMGRFGRHLASRMQELGNDVMIVDQNEELINQLSPKFTDSYIGDCTIEAVIEDLGVNSFDVCFITMGENFQSSLVITSLVKKHNARFIVAKANQDIQADILKTIGANEIIYPEREIADKIAVRYTYNNVYDFINLADGYSITEIPVISSWLGDTIGSNKIRSKYNINIVAIKSGGVMSLPDANYSFRPDDHVVIIGKDSDVFRLTGK